MSCSKKKIIEKRYDIPSNKYSLKNPKQIEGIVREYYPETIDKITNNITEMLDF